MNDARVRTAEDLEWNAALADLIRGVEQAKGAIARVDNAVQRVRIVGRCQRESEPRLLEGLKPAARIRILLVWLRDAIQRRDRAPVAELLRYTDTIHDALDDLVREQGTDHAR